MCCMVLAYSSIGLHVCARLCSQVGLGEWVQVFPEGKINFNGSLGPFRRGAGKLICDARLASGGK